LAIRASAASVTSSADIFRLATPCAISEADSPSEYGGHREIRLR